MIGTLMAMVFVVAVPQPQAPAFKIGQIVFVDPRDREIAAWARMAGWTEKDLPMVVKIADAESFRNPAAINTANSNGSIDYGLMQINTIHKGDGRAIDGKFFPPNNGWRDPVKNLRAALQIKNRVGNWSDWSTFENGKYKHYSPKYSIYVAPPHKPIAKVKVKVAPLVELSPAKLAFVRAMFNKMLMFVFGIKFK